MILESIGVGVLSRLTYDTLKRGKSELDEAGFISEAVWDSIEYVSSQYNLSPAALEAVFAGKLDADEVDMLTEAGRKQVIERLSEGLEEELSEEINVDSEEVVEEFLTSLQHRLASQPSRGVPIILSYVQELERIDSELVDQLQNLLDEFGDDLQILENRTERAIEREESPSDIDFDFHNEEVKKITRRIEDRDGLIITGEAGAGKSTILRKVAQNRRPNEPVYFINARAFSNISNAGDLKNELGLNHPLQQVIKRISREMNGCLLIVDQLDNVRGREADVVFRDLLLDCIEFEQVSVVAACRKWDYEDRTEYRRVRKSDLFTTVELSPLKRSEVRVALHQLDIPKGQITDELIDLGSNPLHLSLIAHITGNEADVDYTDIKNEVALWDRYRKSIVEHESAQLDYPAEEVIRRCISLAREGLREGNRSFSIEPGNRVDEQLLSRGLIQKEYGRVFHFYHDELESYLYAKDATQQKWLVSDVLEDGIDERAGADVFVWMAKIYREENQALGKKFVREAFAEDGLDYYAGSILVNEIGGWNSEQLEEELCEELFDCLDDRSKLAKEFYRDLENPSWVRVLLDEGRFSDPSGPMVQYLMEVAEIIPKQVEEVIHQVNSQNGVILAQLLTAVKNIPSTYARQNTNIFVRWINQAEPEDHYAINLCEFMTDLVERGDLDIALPIFDALLEPQEPQPQKIEPEMPMPIDREIFINQEAQAITDLHSLQDAVDETLYDLLDYDGENLIKILCQHLRTALDLEAEVTEREVQNMRWPQRVEKEPSDPPTNLKDLLLWSLVTGLERWVATSPKNMEREIKVAEYLGGISTFRRIGLHLLRQHIEVYSELVERELSNTDNYSDIMIQHEFFLLLRNGFPVIPSRSQEKVLDIIDQGPDRDRLRSGVEDRYDEISEEDEEKIIEQTIDSWRLARLWMIREELTGEHKRELDDLVSEHGEPEKPTLSSWVSEGGFVNETGPCEMEELRQESSPEEIITKCIEWNPDNKPDDGALLERNHRGFAGQLATLIEEHPSDFIDELPQLIDANEIYTQRSLNALRSVISDGRTFEWSPILDLCEKIVSKEPDEQYSGTRKEICHLIRVGIANDTDLLRDHGGRIKDILLPLLSDPDPDDDEVPSNANIEKEISDSEIDLQSLYNPSRRALNSVRPMAVSAIVTYSLNKVQEEGFEGPGEKEKTGFDPEVRTQLENIIQEDSSLAVRSSIGRNFNTIWWLDNDLIENNLDELFPVDEDEAAKIRFRAVWDNYITQNRPRRSVYELIRNRYFHGISLFAENPGRAPTGLSKKIGSHIMVVYNEGIEDLSDDSLVNHFYAEVSPDTAKHGIGTLLRWAGNSSNPSENWPLVKKLWKWRIEEVEELSEYDSEFVQFVEFLEIVQKDVEISEVKELLISTIPAISGKSWGWDHLESYLLQEVQDDPQDVIEIYETLIGLSEDQWPTHRRFSDKAWDIVETAAASEGSNRTALDVAERIAELRDPEFTEIIDKHT